MPATNQAAIGYASDSGFPLQIAIEHAITSSHGQTGWSVRYVEHGWVHPDERQQGFIDLVLECDMQDEQYVAVIECKRTRDAAWVFMHHSGQAPIGNYFKPWMTTLDGGRVVRHQWADHCIDPPCPEVTFCAIRGQSPSDRSTLLERTGSELILATEALAHSERDVGWGSMQMYVPVIVTTAELKVANFDPWTVSLADGELKHATILDVDFLCLRKQLATRFQAFGPRDPTQLHLEQDRMESSIFVVRANRLTEFLGGLWPKPSVA